MKISLIISVICPCVQTETIRLSFPVLAKVFVSICKYLFSISVFHEVYEISSIYTILMLECTRTFLFVVFPLTFVIVPLRRFPYSKSRFQSSFPISFVSLTIIPCKYTITLSLTLDKISLIKTL